MTVVTRLCRTVVFPLASVARSLVIFRFPPLFSFLFGLALALRTGWLSFLKRKRQEDVYSELLRTLFLQDVARASTTPAAAVSLLYAVCGPWLVGRGIAARGPQVLSCPILLPCTICGNFYGIAHTWYCGRTGSSFGFTCLYGGVCMVVVGDVTRIVPFRLF